jgi:hypothetical protein
MVVEWEYPWEYVIEYPWFLTIRNGGLMGFKWEKKMRFQK